MLQSGKSKSFSCMRREGIVGGVEVYRHAFLTKALDGGEWSPLRPGRFIPRKKNGTH